jgi:hypothetical protein
MLDPELDPIVFLHDNGHQLTPGEWVEKTLTVNGDA